MNAKDIIFEIEHPEVAKIQNWFSTNRESLISMSHDLPPLCSIAQMLTTVDNTNKTAFIEGKMLSFRVEGFVSFIPSLTE